MRIPKFIEQEFDVEVARSLIEVDRRSESIGLDLKSEHEHVFLVCDEFEVGRVVGLLFVEGDFDGRPVEGLGDHIEEADDDERDDDDGDESSGKGLELGVVVVA